MRWGIIFAAVAVSATSARARADVLELRSAPEQPSRHLFYVEALGKAGLYGVGYEHRITNRLSLGAAGSFAKIRDQEILTLSPYVHGKLLAGKHHALFTEIGAVFVRSHLPSPVDDWDGMTDSGGGGFASLGWERDGKHVVVRLSGSLVVGEGGASPWLGFAIGFRP